MGTPIWTTKSRSAGAFCPRLNARVALDDQIEQLNSQPEPYVALRRIYSSQRQAEIRNGRPEDESELYEDLPDFDELTNSQADTIEAGARPVKRLVTPAIALTALAALALPAVRGRENRSLCSEERQRSARVSERPFPERRRAHPKFNAYMDEFTDMKAVANFAIGKYARRFTETELADYQKVFREYALAVYENELDAYRAKTSS
jgi:hypothetical protein